MGLEALALEALCGVQQQMLHSSMKIRDVAGDVTIDLGAVPLAVPWLCPSHLPLRATGVCGSVVSSVALTHRADPRSFAVPSSRCTVAAVVAISGPICSILRPGMGLANLVRASGPGEPQSITASLRASLWHHHPQHGQMAPSPTAWPWSLSWAATGGGRAMEWL